MQKDLNSIDYFWYLRIKIPLKMILMVLDEIHVNYDGLELRIRGTNVGGSFNNDFEMYQLIGEERTLLMTYEERWDKKGYRVKVLSKGILEKDYIENMLHLLLPYTHEVKDAQLIINEEV
jgi:hypothetical protein